ncbi:MAG: hypothetical protein IPQ07_39610 [Myxococcales bacterium]|nr:hypothetical protein [Myxococcales bacterium]
MTRKLKPVMALGVLVVGTAVGVMTWTRCGSQGDYLRVVVVSPSIAITEDRVESHIRLTSHDLTKQAAVISVRMLRQSHEVRCWPLPTDALACELSDGDTRIRRRARLCGSGGHSPRGDDAPVPCKPSPSSQPASPPFQGALLQCPEDGGAWLRGDTQLARIGADGQVRWTVDLPAKPDELYLAGGLLVVTARDATHRLISLDPGTGAIRWTYRAD